MDSDPDLLPAFPSIAPVLGHEDLILEEHLDEGNPPILVLTLAVSDGGGCLWDPQRRHRIFPAKKCASISVATAERPPLLWQTDKEPFVVGASAILYLGSEDIDDWCRSLPPEREHLAQSLFRLVMTLELSAKRLPTLAGIVYRERAEIIRRMEEALASLPHDRMTIPDSEDRMHQRTLRKLYRQACDLGLQKTELVKQLTRRLLPAP